MLYSNSDYFLLWKPHKLPSTFGKEQSLLDYFHNIPQLQKILNTNSDFWSLISYCYLDGYTLEEGLFTFVDNQTTQFTKEQEFGLLNRLDNDTGGFLYFAKTPEIYTLYKAQQKKWLISKIYLAEVQGNPFFKNTSPAMTIKTPIMHHVFDEEKMVVINSPEDEKKWRWKIHKISTTIELITYNQKENTSLLRITIHKWIRHQIRIHCKSIGAPIIGDTIYGQKHSTADYLHLRSVGMKKQ